MDEKQFNDLVERVIFRIMKEDNSQSILTKAYFLIPDHLTDEECDSLVKGLNKIEGKYHINLIFPDCCQECERIKNFSRWKIEFYSNVDFPKGDYITICPSTNKALIVNTALCLENDFQGKWLSKALYDGCPIYMEKDYMIFSGKETNAYKDKMRSYCRDVESYGIRFIDWTEDLPIKKIKSKKLDKKKIITREDILVLESPGTIEVYPGDIITDLAREEAEIKGINIICK